MYPKLKAGEQPTCSKCIYFEVNSNKCHYSAETLYDKDPANWCSNGKWIMRYRPNIFVEGLSSIVQGRARREAREEKEVKYKGNE